MRPVDKKNPNGPKEHGVIGVKDFKKQFDLPFSQENLFSLIVIISLMTSVAIPLFLLSIQ
jgi:hypothetical protein